jgi:hypothetical protein
MEKQDDLTVFVNPDKVKFVSQHFPSCRLIFKQLILRFFRLFYIAESIYFQVQ